MSFTISVKDQDEIMRSAADRGCWVGHSELLKMLPDELRSFLVKKEMQKDRQGEEECEEYTLETMPKVNRLFKGYKSEIGNNTCDVCKEEK